MKRQNQIQPCIKLVLINLTKCYLIILLKKSVKLWKKLFLHLFDLALVNAQILHWKKCTKAFKTP
jgi:hypothetical protein